VAILPFGINNTGQIVGTYHETAGDTHGFVLSGGNYTKLDVPRSFGTPLASPLGVTATAINDSGQIVGAFGRIISLHPPITFNGAFLLNGGVYTDITEPGVLGGSAATGINNAGQIVGPGPGHGVLLSGGSFTDLIVPGSLQCFAQGINDAGVIVGDYNDYLDGPEHGFVLDGGIYTSFDVPGASNTYARAINNAGAIVGYYTDAAGHDHGFVATPTPEPATLLLLGLATLSVIGWACWKGCSTR
jgi:probable HAF family extracellular repeat protein